MSNMSRHFQEIQESEDYQFGWESAERGEPRPDWKPIPGDHTVSLERQQMGWDHYHEHGRAFP